MMACLLTWGVGLAAPSDADAQVASYGAVQATRYVVAQPTTYAPVQPVTYVAAQPVTYTTVQPATYVVQQPATYAAAPAATYAVAQPGGDPYGFTAWLNGVRAQYGLPAVAYDAGLEGWAAANNAQQAARGLGHFVMGPARRQNSAIGNSASIGSQWMNSAAHRAALLDPSITRIGLAGSGSYWTFNAY
jgi:uncharacterized protein YkwD